MVREAEVLLRDLKLRHELCLRHRTEERVERLARLKVNGAVLDLQQNVRREPSVEGLQVVVAGRGPVVAGLRVVDEGAPHHDPVVRGERGCEHVRAVGVRAVVGARPRLAFAVGLNEKTAEVWDEVVNLVRLLLPPSDHFRVERVGGLKAAQLDGRGKARREVDAHAVRAKRVGDGRGLTQIFGAQALSAGVDVIKD